MSYLPESLLREKTKRVMQYLPESLVTRSRLWLSCMYTQGRRPFSAYATRPLWLLTAKAEIPRPAPHRNRVSCCHPQKRSQRLFDPSSVRRSGFAFSRSYELRWVLRRQSTECTLRHKLLLQRHSQELLLGLRFSSCLYLLARRKR